MKAKRAKRLNRRIAAIRARMRRSGLSKILYDSGSMQITWLRAAETAWRFGDAMIKSGRCAEIAQAETRKVAGYILCDCPPCFCQRPGTICGTCGGYVN